MSEPALTTRFMRHRDAARLMAAISQNAAHRLVLLVHPYVLVPGVVVDAVVVRNEAVNVGLPAGAGDVVIDDRARCVIDQKLLDLPDDPPALLLVGLLRLLVEQPVDLRIA